MTAQILDGNATLKAIKAELAERVARLRERGVVPGLGTVLVGDDPGSHWYVNAKHKDCAEIGIASIRATCPPTATQAEVEAVIDELNADPGVHRLPRPAADRPRRVRAALAGRPRQGRRRPAPDQPRLAGARQAGAAAVHADGLSSSCCAATTCRSPAPRSCVIGRGLTVGRPLGLLLTRRSENATVTLCHTGTRDLAGAGPRRPTSSSPRPACPASSPRTWSSPARRVLDVGVTRVDGKIAGDVAPDVADVAGWVAPNPGGVGPMTRAMLLSNIVSRPRRPRVDGRARP